MHAEELAYYAKPGPLTSLGLTESEAAGLPEDPLALCTVARGLILHEMWASLYGIEIPAPRLADLETRSASAMVKRIDALDPGPLAQARPPDRRLIGNCRQFSTLSCALLRRAGIPARARCGFATYFEAGRYIDHWIVEYWEPAQKRWRRVDPQLDDAQQDALSIRFDVTDLPPGSFVPAGEAWQRCRAGEADADQFGILEFWGLWFVRNNVVRDLAALNKHELLPWDMWGLMDSAGELGEAADTLTDQVAAATTADAWTELRRHYEDSDLLRVPPTVTSARAAATVTLTE